MGLLPQHHITNTINHVTLKTAKNVWKTMENGHRT